MGDVSNLTFYNSDDLCAFCKTQETVYKKISKMIRLFKTALTFQTVSKTSSFPKHTLSKSEGLKLSYVLTRVKTQPHTLGSFPGCIRSALSVFTVSVCSPRLRSVSVLTQFGCCQVFTCHLVSFFFVSSGTRRASRPLEDSPCSHAARLFFFFHSVSFQTINLNLYLLLSECGPRLVSSRLGVCG